jgi:hypothetical protein
MKAYGTMWWIAARHWAEIPAFSPPVIGELVTANADRLAENKRRRP